MKIQVFLQSELLTDIEIVEVESTAGHDALHQACMSKLAAAPNETFFLFVEDDDDEKPLDKLKEIPVGARVHLHRLKGIDVAVRYAGRDVRRQFRPSATVGRVKRWATHELGVAPSDAAELMLQVSGTDNRPDLDVHIGALVVAPHRTVTFDLVPSPRVNG